MQSVDQTGLLADARFQFVSIEAAIFPADVDAVEVGRGDTDVLSGAQRALVCLRVLRVDAEVRYF